MIIAVTLPFLNGLVALFVVSVAIAYVCYRFRLVPIVGFLLAGVVIGPYATGLVSELELVNILAEIGVILLLFTIGLEFSLAQLSRIGRAIFVGGGIQVGSTIAVVTAILLGVGASWQAGIYTGCLVALSSTAIVLGLLTEQAMTDAPAGRLSLAFLIFQDLAIVLMVLLVPILAGEGGSALDVLWVLGKAGLLIAAVLILARRVVPWILEHIARTRRTELFLLAVVAICFGTAAISSLAGVSLALGAFLAGLVVSESQYSEQALSEILPLRTIFNAVFFVSVGMLLDISFLWEHLWVVLLAAAAIVALKFVLTSVSVLMLGYPIRIAAATGLALAQIGEFSFVLERAGRAAGLSPAGLAGTGEQAFIAASVLLMIVTPFLLQAGPAVGAALARTPLRRLGSAAQPASEETSEQREDHAVIIGYGPAGKRLVQVMRETGIPFVVIEMNPSSVKTLQEAGTPVIYGDAAREHILELSGIKHAKLCVVVINDPSIAPRIIQIARNLNPTLQLIARTRFLQDVDRLESVGADIVVPEEMETTARLFSHVLGTYMIPPDEIERKVRDLRAKDYQLLRGNIQEAHLMVLQGLDEEGMHTRAVAVREGAPVAGRTLEELALRRNHNLTVLAVRRDGRTIASPAGNFRVQSGDRLVLVGLADQFAQCADLFRSK